ncbi:MAG: PepSY-like domain-containing protein [Saprospiraceae bacterium]|nr:PepSY-like domain-containing protein [Saprospiraceae bacterium]
MKRSILILLSLCISAMTIQGQEGYLASIPVKAGQHLSTQYPDAIVLDWVLESATCIKAIVVDEFDADLESEIFYTVQGDWLESHLAMPLTNTPPSILSAIQSIYPDVIALKSILVEHPIKNTHYEIMVQQENTSIAVINVYPNGQIASEIATR